MEQLIKLIRLPEGKIFQTLRGWVNDNGLAFSPDGRLKASDCDGVIKIWSLPKGKLLQTSEYQGTLYGFAMSPNGKLLASGGVSKTIKLWSLPEGKLLQTLEGHIDTIYGLAFSPDGKLLASGSVDKTIKLWSLPEGKLLQSLEGHSDLVKCLAFSPDGGLKASGSWDETIKLWVLGLNYLSRLPIEQISAEDLMWVQEEIKNKDLSQAEQDWLKFILALVRWQRRFDVEVEEAPQRISAGDFDIEIEE